MLYFAYDASINGDWVSHYAVRFAQSQAERSLHIVHVRDGTLSDAELDERLLRLLRRAEDAGLAVTLEVPAARGGVTATLEACVPSGAEHVLLCGTRARGRGRGLLTGTVAERLLDAGRRHVLAVRVVHPGLLGVPGRLLLPLSGAPWTLDAVSVILRLFGRDLELVNLLHVRVVRGGRFRRLSHERVQHLLEEGRAYLHQVEPALCARLGLARARVDGHVVLSDDVSREIAVAANRTRSRLILMGASRRHLLERLWRGNPLERVLAQAPCDVGIYRGPA
ncbi:MAG: universal stress protein [Candidatus Lambdaproteobacteria bacterium]|nr:universal stress protein [Candidatus Lambdaproteobacteria bacterium]